MNDVYARTVNLKPSRLGVRSGNERAALEFAAATSGGDRGCEGLVNMAAVVRVTIPGHRHLRDSEFAQPKDDLGDCDQNDSEQREDRLSAPTVDYRQLGAKGLDAAADDRSQDTHDTENHER